MKAHDKIKATHKMVEDMAKFGATNITTSGTTQEIDDILPVDAFDSADEALDALVRAMRSGVKATIRTIEIGVAAISSERWGELTKADNERLGRLKVLLEGLKSTTTHSRN